MKNFSPSSWPYVCVAVNNVVLVVGQKSRTRKTSTPLKPETRDRKNLVIGALLNHHEKVSPRTVPFNKMFFTHM